MHATPPSVDTRAVPCRYEYLDALRGWAFAGVLAVHAALHTGDHFPGFDAAVAGKYGVQLFFMTSAFTIFLTLDRARDPGPQAWTDFFIRRFFRILPMFWVGMVLYSFAPGRSEADAAAHFGPLDYALTAALQHGWHPALINSIVPGGWSIAAEGSFYLLAPLVHRLVRTWQGALWLLLGSTLLTALLNLVVIHLYRGRHLFTGASVGQMNGFLSWWFPMQWPTFACGILVYCVVRATDNHPRSQATGAVLLAASAVLLCMVLDIGKRAWIQENAIFALAFVPLMLGLKAWPAGLLVNAVTRFLGKVSYSAYLLHFLVLELAFNSLDVLLPSSWQGSLGAFLLLYAATLAGTAALAWMAWRYVERPFIELGARLIRSREDATHAPVALEQAA